MSERNQWTNPPSGRESATYSNPTFTGQISGPVGSASAPGYAFTGNLGVGFWYTSNIVCLTATQTRGLLITDNTGSSKAELGEAGCRIISSGVATWSSTTATSGAADTGFSRVSAGLVGVGTGAQGSVAGSLRASTYATSAPVTETTATHTVAATTSHLICNRAGDITVTLPTASSFPGRILWIRTIQAQTVTSNAANVVPRTGGSAGTAILAATDGAWTMLVSDGTNWEAMAGTP